MLWVSAVNPTPYTLHPTPYTLHPTPYTRHPTPYTRHPTPYTLHPTPYTLHPTPCNQHATRCRLERARRRARSDGEGGGGERERERGDRARSVVAGEEGGCSLPEGGGDRMSHILQARLVRVHFIIAMIRWTGQRTLSLCRLERARRRARSDARMTPSPRSSRCHYHSSYSQA